MKILTSSWFAPGLPADMVKIGISRGIPRRQPAGYRVYRKLAPGPWFNSTSPEEYDRLYKAEILDKLDPRVVASELLDLARGRTPVMVCYERPGGIDWCHRAMAAQWLSDALGSPIAELGFEHLPQEAHPLMPPELRRAAPTGEPFDPSVYIGRTFELDGKVLKVVGVESGRAIVETEAGTTFPTSAGTLQRHFGP